MPTGGHPSTHEGGVAPADPPARFMLDSVSQAVIALDLDGAITYWNAAAERAFGWTAAEVLGRSAYGLIRPELSAARMQEVLESLMSGREWSDEVTVSRRDGTSFPAYVAASGYYDEARTLLGLVAVVTDLSRVRTAESARDEYQAQLRTVLAEAPVILTAYDADGTVTFMEGRELASIGQGRDFVGLTLAELSDYRPAVADAIRRCLQGSPSDIELVTGGRHLSFCCRPRLNPDGEIVGVLSVATDITERVRATQRSLDTEARWQSLVMQSADAAVIADADTTEIRYVSPAASRLFGWTNEELAGVCGVTLVHPDDRDVVGAALAAVTADPSSRPVVEFRLRCADNSYRWVEETLSNLQDVAGVHGLVGNVRDITARREAEQALRQRDRLAQALASKASDLALIVGEDGRARYATSSESPLNIVADGDILDLYALPHVHPDDRPGVQAVMKSLAVPGTCSRTRFRVRGNDGRWHWVEQTATNWTNDPDIAGYVLNLRDIDGQVAAEAALRESETRYRLIAETAQEGIWATDPFGRTLFANEKMAGLLGVSLAQMYELAPWELISGVTRDGFFARKRRRDRIGEDSYDLEHVLPDGTERLLHVCVSPFADEQGRPGSLAMVTDITESRAAEQTLRHRATHDALTGLANRTLLLTRLEAALQSAAAGRAGPISLLVADIDQFKLINDSFGHLCGDTLLVEVSRRWQDALDDGMLLARLGGDEFVILCEDTGAAGAGAVAARLERALADPVLVEGRSVAVSASLGLVSTDRCPAANAESLLRFADAAVYEAKAKGRGRAEFFTPALTERAERQLQMSNDLKAAIERDELRLHYQPVVELASGRWLGIEALCRWTHPQRGPIAPDEFIAVAEQGGLITALDHWVIRRACREAAQLRRDGVLPADCYLAVNVSAAGIASTLAGEVISEVLNRTGLPPEVLVIEVTESAVMSEPALAEEVLVKLSDLGVRVAIDDFGTGYSSLAYLRRFPVSMLKIDRSFTSRIADSPQDRAIITALVQLAEALNATCVAEGVETCGDVTILRDLRCFAGQGYLWSPAVAPDRLAELSAALTPSAHLTPAVPVLPAVPVTSVPPPRMPTADGSQGAARR